MTKLPDDAPLLRHMEKHLGPVIAGWQLPHPSGRVFIVKFDDRPVEGAVTYATLGLSEVVLHQHDGPEIRQELIFCCWAQETDDEAVALLKVIASDVLDSEHAFEHGQLLGPAGPLLPNATTEALLCTAPVYFPEELHELRDTNPPVLFVWLLPATKREAAFIARRGWPAFEDALEKADPDLLDLRRADAV